MAITKPDSVKILAKVCSLWPRANPNAEKAIWTAAETELLCRKLAIHTMLETADVIEALEEIKCAKSRIVPSVAEILSGSAGVAARRRSARNAGNGKVRPMTRLERLRRDMERDGIPASSWTPLEVIRFHAESLKRSGETPLYIRSFIGDYGGEYLGRETSRAIAEDLGVSYEQETSGGAR